MKVAAIILARGGSVGIVNKNLQLIAGYTLVERAIMSCKNIYEIDDVYVSTDSDEIGNLSEAAGAFLISRPTELSTSQSSSEQAILHFLEFLEESEKVVPEIVVFVQCTSPFIQSEELQQAIKTYKLNPEGTLFSVVKSHDFQWQLLDDKLIPLTPGSHPRLLRQDLPAVFQETGAFYIFRSKDIARSKSRFNQPLKVYESNYWAKFQIDDANDLVVSRAIAQLVGPISKVEPFRVLVTDFDGVHTDNSARLDENGIESVEISRADGLGIEMLKNRGIKVLIISKEKNKVVMLRANKLGIECIQACENKKDALEGWAKENMVSMSDILFVGNDLNDFEVMRSVGQAVAVNDATAEIINVAKFVLKARGGRHAIREICDLVIKEMENDSQRQWGL